MVSISKRWTGYALAVLALVLAAGVVVLAGRGPDVEGASPPVRAALEDCHGLFGSSGNDCYLRHVERRVREAGIEAALKMVSGLAERNPEINEDGHVYVHAVGIAAYRKAGRLHETFTRCTDSFQSGCHHGVIQAHFMALDSVRPDDIRKVCRPYREQGRELLRFQCHHGMGHGLTMYYNHDLRPALKGCDALETNRARESCYGGAFMENVVHATDPHHPASEMAHARTDAAGADSAWVPIDPDDPQHPCSAVQSRYWTACYGMQTSIMLHLNDGDLEQTAEDCENAPDGWEKICYRSLGRSISIRAFDDLGRAARMCQVGSEPLRPHCFQGLAHTLMILGTRPFPDVGFDLCRRVPADQRPERIRCFFGVGRAVQGRFDAADGRETCGRASREIDRTACRIGAGIGDRELETLMDGGREG